ncbi:patatin-like phospholipase family protein [Halonatronum saccharophilum]|uniref:patatin-like phospholipase family protein n=1 Tax=Halonatronum saccharophilum TaxID=150060 RepID=UPI000488FC1C|nr:patatin-like phospholipase family protein [Halonatronum saccharophilum]
MKKTAIIIFSLIFYLVNVTPILAKEVEVNKDHFPKELRIEEGGEIYIVESNYLFEEIPSPRVALALSGGGARAFVNIGIIKALEEEGIPIDLIVGTSMGSIVGTMYGSGLSTSDMEDIVSKVPFEGMFDINLPSRESLVTTSKVNTFIEEISPNNRLEEFKIPTALLSYDLSEGKKFLHTQGRISEVIQSSYAIPFYFPPHQTGDRFLVDPGIVEISPAKAAKVLGADFVIATTSYDELPYQEYDSPGRAAARFLSLMQKENGEEILNKYADIVIETNVGKYSFMDFKLANELIDIGYKEAKEMLPIIKNMLRDENISLREHKVRPNLDHSNKLMDLKYNRLIIEERQFRPIFYYGQDQFLFYDTLYKSMINKGQYGFILDYGHLETSVLTVGEERIEGHLRWKKVSDNLDFITRIKVEDRDGLDFKSGIKYYQDNYTLEGGIASLGDKNLSYITTQLDLTPLNSSYLRGKSNFLVDYDGGYLGSLIEGEARWKISSIWSLRPKVVFNSTDGKILSPEIYRGSDIDSFFEEQVSLEFLYTHNIIRTIEFLSIMKLSNVSVYPFLDYQSSDYDSFAYGLGSEFNFELLGVKPVDFKSYISYDQRNDDFNFKLQLEFDY